MGQIRFRIQFRIWFRIRFFESNFFESILLNPISGLILGPISNPIASPSDSLISLSYSMPTFSTNSFGLFYNYHYARLGHLKFLVNGFKTSVNYLRVLSDAPWCPLFTKLQEIFFFKNCPSFTHLKLAVFI